MRVHIALVGILAILLGGCCRCPPVPPPPTGSVSRPDEARGPNRDPRIRAVLATANGRRLRAVPPGTTVRVEGQAVDPDGDRLTYRWRTDRGALDRGATREVLIWRPGDAIGVARVSLTVDDGRGGIAERTLEIPVDTVLAFSGRVIDRNGRPVEGATVSVADQVVRTGAEGGFVAITGLTDGDRYALTIERSGYGLYSQVFDGPVDELTFRLTPGTTVVADAGQTITLQDQAASQCTGPLSAQVDWTLYPAQRAARVFTSTGAPWTGAVPQEALDAIAVYQQAIPCGPGVSVTVPPNSLAGSDGGLATGAVEITVATADLYAPGGMPGDFTTLSERRNFGMQSFGAGTVLARQGGEPLQLSDSARITLTIPVPPLHERYQTRLDSAMPFLLYDPGAARWAPTWTARLVAGGTAFQARVDHLSAFNTDLVKVDQSCIRIDSSNISGDYTMEATIPLPNSAPSIRSYPVDNTPETLHTLYNLPSASWIVIVPFREEASGPVPLGTFVVNTGPPQNPTDPNRPVYPYAACQSDLTLSEVPGTTMLVADGRGHANGPLPVVWYSLTEPSGADIYPLGNGSTALCGLFDTGATRVFINDRPPPNAVCGPNWGDSDTGHLGLSANATVNVRLNGLAMQASDFSIPIGPPGAPGGAQLEIQGVTAEPRDLPVTLLGTPVSTAAVAVIDYRTTITAPSFVTGPDITFFAPGDTGIPTSDISLTLQRFGVPERFILTGVVFALGGNTFQDQTTVRFLFDTATTPTIVGDNLASALGLAGESPVGGCLTGMNNRYEIDSVTMTGTGGSYRVENAVVCWDQASIAGPWEAVIGANLFDQMQIVFDGPNNSLGVGY